MNGWTVHFSAFKAVDACSYQNKVYMAAENGIVVFDSDDNSVSTLTVTNGLSDLGISALASNDEVLIIGYENGNIDVLSGNDVINVPWLKLTQESGSKTINAIYFVDNLAYLATNMGILVYNIQKNEIKDTYYPYSNASINDVTVLNDSIYASSDQGIYVASLSNNFLNDYNQWTSYTLLPSYLSTSTISDIETINNQLFFVYDSDNYNEDTLYYVQNNQLQKLYSNPVTINRIKSNDDEFLVINATSVEKYNANLNRTDIVFEYTFGTSPSVAGATYFSGEFYIADKGNGMIKAYDSYNNQSLYSNSPYTDGCYRIDIQYGNVLVAGGGLTENLHNNYFRNGAYLYKDYEWSNFNHMTVSDMKIDSVWDVIGVSVNQNNTEQMAISSYSTGGMFVIENGEVTSNYNGSNSPLEIQSGNGNTVIVPDLKYDDDGNLWVVNAGLEPLKVLTPEGVWYTFSLGTSGNNNFPYRLFIDSDGNKWVAFENIGIVVFNEHGTFLDTSDDEMTTLTTSDGYGSLPSTSIKTIAEDVDGEIWIGTELGLVVLYSKSNLYGTDYGDHDASEILLLYDGETEVLLGESNITAIAVDGGNRKWIGTGSSGVFCLSDNGTEEIYRYTTDNSPLISNNILDVKIDHLSGDVYFATEDGLMSFRSDATIADNTFSSVSVFPNPVRPDFNGNISIQGLGYDSDVKITDVSGNVVYQTVSNGGTVMWNGNRLDGERVQSGVYLVWTGLSFGKGKNVAKILIIN